MRKEVVDCSVFVKLFIPEAGSDRAVGWSKAWRSGKFSVWAPQLAAAEFANVIWHKVRSGEISRPFGRISVVDFTRLPLNLVDHSALIEGAYQLALSLNITVYDALYAALAYRINAPLLTADKALAKKLKSSPVVCEAL